jgi:arabinogalactan endo-1,4-beta-galactosidase
MKAAINGVNDAAGATPPKIIVHIDRGGDWTTTKWFFDNLAHQQVPFDIIGESYYAWWHGDLAALSNCLNNVAQRYNKPVIVAETAYPWTNSYSPGLGFPISPAGQVQYTTALASIVKGVPGGKGAGIIWWGTEYVRLSGYNLANFDKTSFFNYSGNALPVTAVFGQLSAPVKLEAALTNNSLSLKWPLSGAGMRLTRTASLASAAPWVAVTNAVQNTNGVFSASIPIGASPATFYRLQSN